MLCYVMLYYIIIHTVILHHIILHDIIHIVCTYQYNTYAFVYMYCIRYLIAIHVTAATSLPTMELLALFEDSFDND